MNQIPIKDKLKSFLEHCPKLYNLVKKSNSTYRSVHYRLRSSLLGTKLEERYWATRHLRKGDDWGGEMNDWVRGYWDSCDHPHRFFLLENICKFNPSNVLEIGCNCGPNLYLLAKKYPNAKMIGVDINPEAVRKGNEMFAQEGISTVKLLEGKADELGCFKDKSFDIVFTDAVLIYIGPDKIREVIKEMLRIARRAVIMLEWHSFNCSSRPLGVYVGHWMRDYLALLMEFVPRERIMVNKLPEELWPDKNWQRWGGVIEVVKE